jgi:methionyl-tRNA formyltransferase
MKFSNIDSFFLFGGGQLLCNFALKLIEDRFTVLVITSERHSRENVIADSKLVAFSKFLADNNIDFHCSQDINTDKYVIDKVTDTSLGLSFGAAWLFKSSFIKLFKGRLLNLHGTRLPQNRGAGGFSWQILRNNRLGFGLIHEIEPGVDTGAIIKYNEFFYPPECRIPDDYNRIYISNSYKLLSEFLEDIKNDKEFVPIKQSEYFSIYWPRLSTETNGFIDWNWALKDIELFICAFDDPYKGASTFINSQRVFLKKCFSDFNDGCFHPFQKGMLYKKSPQGLFVSTEDGTLIIKEVRDENGLDVINKIRVGDRFYTPVKILEKAKQERVDYTPMGLKK